METAVRMISNASGDIELFDLYKNDGSFYHQPYLVFNKAETDSTWDDCEYIHTFFRGLKKNKKEQIKELKEFCKDNKFDYNETFEDLVNIFKTSKKLKFWKQQQ